MPKLPPEYQFLDLSDYGRPFAIWIAESIKNTSLTPVHVTIGFIISGLLAIACMLNHWFWAAAFFLILKSIIDGADGELARVKNTPSYTGRYFDSNADLILNFLFLYTICYITDGSLFYTFLAFIGIQLQGTLYNYYYVIMRNKFHGDTTSRIFEDEIPKAMKGESQRNVNFQFRMYKILYSGFDKIIYWIDKDATNCNYFPKWMMTMLSTFGLGFQLLIMAVLLVLNLEAYIIPFFILYSAFIFVFIAIRRWVN